MTARTQITCDSCGKLAYVAYEHIPFGWWSGTVERNSPYAESHRWPLSGHWCSPSCFLIGLEKCRDVIMKLKE